MRKELNIVIKVVRFKHVLPKDTDLHRVIWLHDYPNQYLLIPREALDDPAKTTD